MKITQKCIFIFILIIFCGCTKEINIYDSKELRSEIEELIVQIIELDSIEVYYSNYGVFKVLPEYVNRSKIDTFKPGPPPGSKYLFPNLESETRENSLKFKEEDYSYLKLQELHSKRIELSDEEFGNRKTEINLETKIPYVYFSIPIFNKEKSLAWIRTGLFCGRLCGEGRTLILNKKDGKWMIIKSKTDWVS